MNQRIMHYENDTTFFHKLNLNNFCGASLKDFQQYQIVVDQHDHAYNTAAWRIIMGY